MNEQPQQGYSELVKPKRDRAVSRFYLIVLMFFIGVVIIWGRLFWIQVVRHSDFKKLAVNQYQESIVLSAKRGEILDRNGNILVSSVYAYDVAIDPGMIDPDKKNTIAQSLSGILHRSKSEILSKLQSEKRFVWLERGLTAEKAGELKKIDNEFIILIQKPVRFFRYPKMAAHTLGLANVDNKGITGIEKQYDAWLSGNDGYSILYRDGLGQNQVLPEFAHKEPINGHNVELTLDKNIQLVLEEELRIGLETSRGKSGMGIIMDPKTGEILAMAHYPTFQSVERIESNDALRIKTISDVFEPGSTFKLVTALAALNQDQGILTHTYATGNGNWSFRGENIIDHEKFGTVDFREAMVVSSNIALSKIGLQVGEKAFYEMARNLGFGLQTGIDLPGEENGLLKNPTDWSGISLAWLSFGYEVLVTPLQLVNAYAAVANGGYLMKPYLVRAIKDETGKKLENYSPVIIRKVFNSQVADTLANILQQVVQKGTGSNARSPIVSIAGKTGTAQKVDEGKYKKQYMASFVGFFPYDSPEYVGIILIDSPQKGYYGGTVSAPVLRRIAERITAMEFSHPKTNMEVKVAEMNENPLYMPDVTMLSLAYGHAVLAEMGFDIEYEGSGLLIISTDPAPGTLVQRSTSVRLQISEEISAHMDFRPGGRAHQNWKQNKEIHLN